MQAQCEFPEFVNLVGVDFFYVPSGYLGGQGGQVESPDLGAAGL